MYGTLQNGRGSPITRVFLLLVSLGSGVTGCDSGSEMKIQQTGKSPAYFSQTNKTANPYTGKTGSNLLEVIRRIQAAGITQHNSNGHDLEAFSTLFVRVSSAGEIQVYVRLRRLDGSVIEKLEARSLRIEVINNAKRIVQGWMPFEAIEPVSELEMVERIEAPAYTHPDNRN